MSEELRRLVQIRAGGRVERCHCFPHHGAYSNAAHQWGVAMLMQVLWPEDFSRLVLYCLTHDVPEAWTGDTPAPVKRYSSPVKMDLDWLEGLIMKDLDLPDCESLSAEDRLKIKSCDILELYIWSMEQVSLGNQFVSEILAELEVFIMKRPLPSRAAELHRELCATPWKILPKMSGVIRTLCDGEDL